MGKERSANSQWISAALIVVLAILIFFAPSYGWKLRDFLSPPPALPQADAGNLLAENAALKTELAKLEVIQSELPTSTPGEVRAMVYSRYPMNFKNEFLVDAGTNQGVAVGDAVMFQGAFVGQVESAYPESALVTTIFDNGFKIPVRIGSSGYDGLLQGGATPFIGSITASAPVGIGDAVYTAASGLPYGLPVALVTATGTSPDSLFEQAEVNVPYDINDVQTVLIIK